MPRDRLLLRMVKRYAQMAQKEQSMYSELLPLESWALKQYAQQLHIARRIFRQPRRSPKLTWRSAWVVLTQADETLIKRIGDMGIKRHSNKEFQFDSWVNLRLEEQHKEELVHLAENVSHGQLINWLASMAFEGYSFSASWDEYSDAVQVSLVCKAPDDPNYGLGLSARHPDFDLAVLTLQYKHEQLCDHNWSSIPPTPKGTAWG